MSNQQPKSKDTNSQFQRTVKGIDRKSLILGSVIATIISITPYLFYLYESVPQQKVWNTFLFTYDSHLWHDANLAMWILTGKVIPFILLLIWFLTNRQWWFHALLVPLAMYLYQIIGFVITDTGNVDEFHLIYMVPIMAIVIPSIYLIRAKMFYRVNDVDKSMEELEEEFRLSGKGFFGKLSDYF